MDKKTQDTPNNTSSFAPDTHFSERFSADLRARLMQTKIRPLSSPYASIFVSRVFYGALSSVLTLLIAVPFTYIATQKSALPDQIKNISSVLNPKQQISDKGINAFGRLAPVPTSSNIIASTSKPASITVAPDPDSVKGYSYSYKGDSVLLNDTEEKVFKRTKGIDSDKQLSGIIQNSKFNLTNLSTFSDLTLKDIVMGEDKPFGYSIDVNFSEGSITINPEALYWATTTNSSMASSTALSDDELLSVANEFVKDHKIDMTVYDRPLVASEKEGLVVYPLLIEGNKVHENNGRSFGFMVSVDANQKKVSRVINLTSQTYESSLYKLETNFETILEVATSTLNKSVSDTETLGDRQAVLGTPTHVLMHYWFYDVKSQTNNELFIPALSFSITYSIKDVPNTLPTTIVVPLVKDFLGKPVVFNQ